MAVLDGCSLDAGGLEGRVERWRRLADDALLEAVAVAGGARQRYRADDAVERELRTLVAAEADCCPTIEFALSRDSGALVLDVRGPSAATRIFAGAA